MISNYSKPQSIIRQLREILPDPPGEPINAFIVGPQYDLGRYTEALEREEMGGYLFSDDGVEVSYEGKGAADQVDKDFVRLFGEDLEAELAVFLAGSTPKFQVLDLASPEKIRLVNGGTTGQQVSSQATLYGRAPQAGDIVLSSHGGGDKVRRRVVRLEREFEDAVVGDPVAFSKNPELVAASSVEDKEAPAGWTITEDDSDNWVGLLRDATFEGKYGDRYTIRVTKAGAPGTAEVSIRSASGRFSADDVATSASGDNAVINHSELGGLTITLTPDPVANLQLNQTFKFTVFGAYTPLELDPDASPGPNLAITGDYGSDADTIYNLQVITGSTSGFGGAVVRVSDNNGVDVTHDVTLTEGLSFAMGTQGLFFVFDNASETSQDGLRKGDLYQVTATAAAQTGTESIVVLNGPAVNTTGWTDTDTNLRVEFRLPFVGEVDFKGETVGTPVWTAEDGFVDVKSGLKVEVDGRTSGNEWVILVDGVGRLFAHWRALVAGGVTDPIERVVSVTQVESKFGTIDLDNPLAYGIMVALEGAQGRPVFASRVSANTVAGYNEVLRRAENRADLYAVVPLTYDESVVNAFKSHAETQSMDTRKKWRRVYAATQNPGKYSSLTVTDGGAPVKATVLDLGGENVRVVTEDTDFVEEGVQPGDLFRTNYTTDGWGEVTYDEFVVDTVTGSNQLVLKSGPVSDITTAQKFEVWKPDTGRAQAEFVAERSKSFRSDRVINVWVDRPRVRRGGVMVDVPVYFVSAEVAGLRSAVLPQQGLTYTELETVSDASLMYTKYTDEELNIAAANGAFIVTANAVEDVPFIRHQLTTDTTRGSLYYEDSVGTNFDEISFAMKGIVDPFIGKRNATPGTVREIRNRVESMLIDRTKGEQFLNIGPQVVEIVPNSLVVDIDPVLRDRINIRVSLILPLPINTIVVEMTARVNLGNE